MFEERKKKIVVSLCIDCGIEAYFVEREAERKILTRFMWQTINLQTYPRLPTEPPSDMNENVYRSEFGILKRRRLNVVSQISVFFLYLVGRQQEKNKNDEEEK